MNGQQIGRRSVLGVIAAVTLAWRSTSAAPSGPNSYGSREEYEDLCTGSGGEFTDTGDGNIWCQYSDGFQEVCDVNGDDCYIFSKPKRPGRPGAGPTPPVAGLAVRTGSAAGTTSGAHGGWRHRAKRRNAGSRDRS